MKTLTAEERAKVEAAEKKEFDKYERFNVVERVFVKSLPLSPLFFYMELACRKNYNDLKVA